MRLNEADLSHPQNENTNSGDDDDMVQSQELAGWQFVTANPAKISPQDVYNNANGTDYFTKYAGCEEVSQSSLSSSPTSSPLAASTANSPNSSPSTSTYSRLNVNLQASSAPFVHFPQTQSPTFVEADIRYISTGTLDPPILTAPQLMTNDSLVASSAGKMPAHGKSTDTAQFVAQTIVNSSNNNNSIATRVLGIPEILNQILEYVDMNGIPQERLQKRRRPMSLRHALLIYGDPTAAKNAYHNGSPSLPSTGMRSVSTPDVKAASTVEGLGDGCLDVSNSRKESKPTLLNCMLVNRLWYQVTSDVLFKRLHFKGNCAWEKFAIGVLEKDEGRALDNVRCKPSILVLHKCALANQPQIKTLSKLGGKLQWLEFYTCPLIVPTLDLVSGGQLRKLVLPGCTNLTDKVLNVLTQQCPLLEHLDLRACDMVSDAGIRAVARNCPQLKMLNVGRTQRGELITYSSIKHIAKKTRIETLGLAGCHVDDRAMWALALYRGPFIQRLSLNNCLMLTNESVPKILRYMRSLTVLELRGCVQITDVRPIVQFKRYRELQGHPPLIEGCEVFDLRMRETEWIMEIEISRQVAQDCMEWINQPDNDIAIEEIEIN